MRVAISGFGRIGRSVLRAVLQGGTGKTLDVVAINSPGNPRTLAHLLKYDSTYGTLPIDVGWKPDAIQCGNLKIPCISENDPSKIDWAAFEVDLVLECSGNVTERETAQVHLSSGAKRVLVGAPSRDADVTLIAGCNMHTYSPQQHRIISMGSCTLNCLAPTLKVLMDNFGVANGFATALHSYTNDQRLLDGSHEDLRRARAAGGSIIPTSTGASRTIGEVFPSLKGKIACTAIRVPTPAVSLLNLEVLTRTQPEAHLVNRAYEEAASNQLKGIVSVSNEPLVSVDYKTNPHSSVIDAMSTETSGPLVRVMAWYDNEWAYALRLIETARFLEEGRVEREPVQQISAAKPSATLAHKKQRL